MYNATGKKNKIKPSVSSNVGHSEKKLQKEINNLMPFTHVSYKATHTKQLLSCV